MTHTPGPWRINEDRLAGLYDIIPERDNDGAILAEVWMHKNGEADARLIAAAPELLAGGEDFAESLTDAMLKCIADAFGPTTAGVLRIQRDELRAAIAKAWGEDL